MAWARISDDFHDHPKVAELTVDLEGLAAMGLWTLALSWVRADRRRAGVVPTGIAVRLSAGNGKQLASRLVEAELWDEVPGGWRFHDFDHIYTPEDLAQKRAEAGRKGGRASGQTRRAKAQGTKPEANPKQSASVSEAKQAEASHARPGATTHYPEASYEASSPLSPPEGANGNRRKRATRIPDDFTVTPEMVEWAQERVPHVDGRHETEKFVNYWQAKGSNATKLDWPATWRNWMLTAGERTPSNVLALPVGRLNGTPNGRRPSSTDRAVAEGLAVVAHFEALEAEQARKEIGP